MRCQTWIQRLKTFQLDENSQRTALTAVIMHSAPYVYEERACQHIEGKIAHHRALPWSTVKTKAASSRKDQAFPQF